MIPIISIIGRPNVGKSTLFNKLTKTNDALIGNLNKITYDRKYGKFKWNKYNFIIIDTGGINKIKKNSIEKQILNQSLIAIEESDIILYMIDHKENLNQFDLQIISHLINRKKNIIIVINKIDIINKNKKQIINKNILGIKEIIFISAYYKKGINKLIKKIILVYKKKIYILNNLEKKENKIKSKKILNKSKFLAPIKIAIIGRPNVGKSTLINLITKEERMIVFNTPGTTRDHIYIPVEYKNKKYIFIDTPGICRNNKIKNKIIKFSIIKTLKTILKADIVLLIINISNIIYNQDLSLLEFILNNKKALVIAINKCDILSKSKQKEILEIIKIKLKFINFIKINFISALKNKGINNLFKSINETYKCIYIKINTSNLNNILKIITNKHQPKIINGKKIKLKYANVGGYNPLIIIIHGKRLELLTDSYKRYIIKNIQYKLNIIGNPIQIKFINNKKP